MSLIFTTSCNCWCAFAIYISIDKYEYFFLYPFQLGYNKLYKSYFNIKVQPISIFIIFFEKIYIYYIIIICVVCGSERFSWWDQKFYYKITSFHGRSASSMTFNRILLFILHEKYYYFLCTGQFFYDCYANFALLIKNGYCQHLLNRFFHIPEIILGNVIFHNIWTPYNRNFWTIIANKTIICQ